MKYPVPAALLLVLLTACGGKGAEAPRTGRDRSLTRRAARRLSMASTGPGWSVRAPRWDPVRHSAQGDAAAEAELAAPARRPAPPAASRAAAGGFDL